MNCKRIANGLIAYLDGRASPSECREVEAHLEGCPACWNRVQEFRRLWKVLGEAPELEPSPGFDAQVRQRIGAEPKPLLWGWPYPSPRMAFSLALLVALSAYLSTRPLAPVDPLSATARSEEEFKMIKDLGVLEDYDVLSNFDALSELPLARHQQTQGSQDDRRM